MAKTERQRRRHRHTSRKPFSSTILDLSNDYNAQFPALSAPFSLEMDTEPQRVNFSYSEIAARQYEVENMKLMDDVSDATVRASFVPASLPTLLNCNSSIRTLAALRTWIPSASLPRVQTFAPRVVSVRPLPTPHTRSTFDKLFSNKKPEQMPTSETTGEQKSQEKNKIVSILRQKLSQSTLSHLMLPDYVLKRLITSNPELSALIIDNQLNFRSSKRQRSTFKF